MIQEKTMKQMINMTKKKRQKNGIMKKIMKESDDGEVEGDDVDEGEKK